MMNGRMPAVSDWRTFLLLTVAFALFLCVQVLPITVSSDVIAFALRSTAPKPILGHAYLDARTLLHGTPLPNYHLSHTVLLWLVYQLAPGWLRHSVVPAGLFSALCGGLAVGLTFLIWLRLGLRRAEAASIAVVAGLIPSIWYHGLIGEVYMPQLTAVLLFVALFLHARYLLAALAMLLGILISPLAGRAFPLVLLHGWNKRLLWRAAWVAGLALLLYVAIHAAVGSNCLQVGHGLRSEAMHRPLGYKLLTFVGLVLLNLHVLIGPLIKGWQLCLRRRKRLLRTLAMATAPHLLLPVVSADFLLDKGCFFLPLFWALAMPIGVAVAEGRTRRWVIPCAVGLVVVMQGVWALPSYHLAEKRSEAGIALRARFGQGVKVIGDWGTALPVAVEIAGWDYDSVASHYFDCSFPALSDLEATEQDSLLVVIGSKPWLRRLVGRLPFPEFKVAEYKPAVSQEGQQLQQVLANDDLSVYLWTRHR